MLSEVIADPKKGCGVASWYVPISTRVLRRNVEDGTTDMPELFANYLGIPDWLFPCYSLSLSLAGPPRALPRAPRAASFCVGQISQICAGAREQHAVLQIIAYVKQQHAAPMIGVQ